MPSYLSLIQRAATGEAIPVWHLSFKGALDLVTFSHESFRAHAARPRKRDEAIVQSLEICAARTIDIRPFQKEPRAVRRRPKPHPLLTTHRSKYQEIPHRSRYKKLLNPVTFRTYPATGWRAGNASPSYDKRDRQSAARPSQVAAA